MPEERYVTLAEVKQLLEEASEGRELTPDQKLAMDHAQKVAALTPGKARELQADLRSWGSCPMPCVRRSPMCSRRTAMMCVSCFQGAHGVGQEEYRTDTIYR